MMEVAVQGRDEGEARRKPGEAARKRVAVDLIRNHEKQLRWSARRFSICEEDAEDAYQRGIEILLSKAPSTELNHLLPWTRTVIKHEALAIRKSRERSLGHPGRPSDDGSQEDDWIDLIPSTGDGPDELTVRRERVDRSREALSLLKPAELKALTQLAEGFSYEEIGDLNQWTRTKVNRCLAEGRARFRSVFRESEAGERCHEFEPLLSACCDGELDPVQIESLEKHMRACGHCRATLRAYRAAPKAAAAIAPLLPVGHSFWERVQEVAVGMQLRFQGIGKNSESALQGVMSGGTGGTGLAAAAKLAAVCAGTAGTAAMCAATGVLPAADLISPAEEKTRVVREVQTEPPRPQVGYLDPPVADEPATSPEVEPPPESAPPVATASEEPVVDPPAPEPTPTEVEFTPEAAGTPVQAPPPPVPQPASNPVPVGNGGGEFAP